MFPSSPLCGLYKPVLQLERNLSQYTGSLSGKGPQPPPPPAPGLLEMGNEGELVLRSGGGTL